MKILGRILNGALIAAGGLAVAVVLVIFALAVVYWLGQAL